ncbi:MAG: hypothetical protein AAFX00_10635 [Pseudomonadota bacterium]
MAEATDAAEQELRLLDELSAEVKAASPEAVILSDEGLFVVRNDSDFAFLKRLSALFDRLVIVAFVRRQDEQSLSRYKQSLREGKTHSLKEFLNRKRPHLAYAAHFDQIARALPDAEVRLSAYHSRLLREVPLFQRFADLCGLQALKDVAQSDDRVNTSLDALGSEFVRRYNMAEGRMAKPLALAVASLCTGPDLHFPLDERKAFMARFDASNRDLVDRYLPDAEDVFLSCPRDVDGMPQEEVTDQMVLEFSLKVLARSQA